MKFTQSNFFVIALIVGVLMISGALSPVGDLPCQATTGSCTNTTPPFVPPPISGDGGGGGGGSTTPPPSTSGLVTGENVLKNSEFLSGTSDWRAYAGAISVTNGVMRLTPNSNTISHFGQGVQPVGPGQTITIKTRVRSGGHLFAKYNNAGCGIGMDFREYQTGNYALIGTFNGPATNNTAWAIITANFVVPARNRADAPVPASTYSVVDEATGNVLQSTTYQGARWGRSSNSDNGLYDPRGNSPVYYMTNDYPSKMNVVEWNHDWFNGQSYCEYDYVKMSIT